MPSFVCKEPLNSVNVFWLETKRLLEALSEEAQRLARENPEIEKIILFGSLAENRAAPGSDADILIILAASNTPFLERLTEWSAKIRIDFPVDIFPHTPGMSSVPLWHRKP